MDNNAAPTAHLEIEEAKAEIQILSWEEMDVGEYQPMVYVTLTFRGDYGPTFVEGGVWRWSTDHFLNVIYGNIQDYLERYCPAPKKVWEAFTALLERENLIQYCR